MCEQVVTYKTTKVNWSKANVQGRGDPLYWALVAVSCPPPPRQQRARDGGGGAAYIIAANCCLTSVYPYGNRHWQGMGGVSCNGSTKKKKNQKNILINNLSIINCHLTILSFFHYTILLFLTIPLPFLHHKITFPFLQHHHFAISPT